MQKGKYDKIHAKMNVAVIIYARLDLCTCPLNYCDKISYKRICLL